MYNWESLSFISSNFVPELVWKFPPLFRFLFARAEYCKGNKNTLFPVVAAVLAVSGQWVGNNVFPSFMISSQGSSSRTGERGDSPRSLSLSEQSQLQLSCCSDFATNLKKGK